MGNKLIKIALISRYLIVKIRKSQNQTSNSCLLKAGVGGVGYFDSVIRGHFEIVYNLPVEKTRVDFLIRGQPLGRSYVRSTWPTLRSKILTRSKFQSHGGHDGLDSLSFWRLLEFFREFVPQHS